MKRLIFTLFLFLFVPFASADSDAYEIQSVFVNGISAEDAKIQVELGSTMDIQVLLEGTGESTDVRVHAWIGGYAYESIEESTDVFDVENGVSYKKTLSLDIPEDLDVSEHEYTLHVRVYDSTNKEEKSYTLYFEQEEHDIVVEDIFLSSSTIASGDYLAVNARLENQGEQDEENLKITVSIPLLGVSQRVYMDTLFSGDQDDSPTVYLLIPQNVAGDYEVLMHVAYNNGYSEVSESSFLTIAGEMVYDENTFVSISRIDDLVAGEESSYKVQVTNLADSTKTFTLDVDGLDAEYVESITVPAESSGEFIFTLHPEDVGSHSVFVSVHTDEGLVTEKLLTVSVEERSAQWTLYLALLLAVLVVVGILSYLRGM